MSSLVSTLTAPRNITRDLHVTYVVTSDHYTEYTLRSATGDNLTVLDRVGGREVRNDSTDNITSRLTSDERALIGSAIRVYLDTLVIVRARLDDGLGANPSERDVRNAALAEVAHRAEHAARVAA